MLIHNLLIVYIFLISKLFPFRWQFG